MIGNTSQKLKPLQLNGHLNPRIVCNFLVFSCMCVKEIKLCTSGPVILQGREL